MDSNCDQCGLVALGPYGGMPVTIQQTEVVLLGENGYRVNELPRYGATFCSLRCAADALAKHGSGY